MGSEQVSLFFSSKPPPHSLGRPGHSTGREPCSREARAQPPHSTAPLCSQDKGECSPLMDFSPRASEEYAFSGHSSRAAFECQPGKCTKAGCCPCILGAGGGDSAWHGGTTCPGEGGCRRQHDQESLCRVREGVQSLPGSIWGPFSTQVTQLHLQVAGDSTCTPTQAPCMRVRCLS